MRKLRSALVLLSSANRPGSTSTGCPSPLGVTEESHGQVSQKAQNSGTTRTSSNRSAVDGGGSVAIAADIGLLLCVVRRYTDASLPTVSLCLDRRVCCDPLTMGRQDRRLNCTEVRSTTVLVLGATTLVHR